MRNCPWVGALWARGLNALERYGCEGAVHEETYRRALGAGIQASFRAPRGDAVL